MGRGPKERPLLGSFIGGSTVSTWPCFFRGAVEKRDLGMYMQKLSLNIFLSVFCRTRGTLGLCPLPDRECQGRPQHQFQ